MLENEDMKKQKSIILIQPFSEHVWLYHTWFSVWSTPIIWRVETVGIF